MSSLQSRSIGLDLVRSVAILLVVLAHGFGMIYAFVPAMLANVINEQAGGLGVILFFVLSGFLIGRIFINIAFLGEGPLIARILNFWARRWLRTLPNYYLFLVVYFIIGLNQLSSHQHFSSDEAYSPLNYVFFLQNLIVPNKWFFSQSWSLAVEEWFYLLLPLVFFLSSKFFSKQSPLIMGVVFLFLIWSVKLSVGCFSPHLMKQTVFMSLDYILFGVLLAACYFDVSVQQKILNSRKRLFVLGFLLFGASELLCVKGLLCVEPLGMMFFAAAFTLMLPFMKELVIRPRILAALIETISKSAYSTYLSNFLVLHFLFERPFESLLNTSDSTLKVLLFFAYITVNVTVGYLVYVSFERPILRFRDRKTKMEGYSVRS